MKEEVPERELTLTEAVEQLRAIKGNGWKDVDDPWEELRRIREGPDEEASKK